MEEGEMLNKIIDIVYNIDWEKYIEIYLNTQNSAQ
jgi:hypothetical protein